MVQIILGIDHENGAAPENGGLWCGNPPLLLGLYAQAAQIAITRT
jgi:hypothetical protein